MQKEIGHGSVFFDDQGNLIQTGWAKQLLLKYNRNKKEPSLCVFKRPLILFAKNEGTMFELRLK